MPMVRVQALWCDPTVGREGYIGAILRDGTPVALCSVEKFSLGRGDSLNRGWVGHIRKGSKTVYSQYTEAELRAGGLGNGPLRLTVPSELITSEGDLHHV